MHLLPAHFHWPLSGLEHGAFVLAGLLIYLTSTRLSREHRHPSAALAWVLTMSLLPYAGIPLFLLFGVRKVPRPHARLRQADSHQPHQADHWALDLGQALALPAATRDNTVAFHADGQTALDALLGLIDRAQRH
ncbi:MAG: cardiolipin synthase, partial [Aquabacterium sp.]|uniref:PLDc N-terminal domain-containing protein n=1 Tax=Aquabacterium sp. TaxID=1872578 RepID=UPI0011FD51C1